MLSCRCLYAGLALSFGIGASRASSADFEELRLFKRDPSARSQWSPPAGSVEKSIFELNSKHFNDDNFHSHHVKFSHGEPFKLTYHTVGNYNITMGDVIVDPQLIHAAAAAEREVSRQAALLGLDESAGHHLDASHPAAVDLMSIVISSSGRRWDCPVPIRFGDVDERIVQEALLHIQDRTRWIFAYANENTRDYIEFVAPEQNQCASMIGKVNGGQQVLLGDGCGVGSAVHEILHALGAYHEHTAENRDDYVRIHEENISQDTGIAINFAIQENQIQVGDYDFNSIMHYGSTDFSVNSREQTIEILPQYLSRVCGIGQRAELSYGDVLTAESLYDDAQLLHSDCPAKTDSPPAYPQCNQPTEFRICGRQFVNAAINGKYIQVNGEINGRPYYQQANGGLYLYYTLETEGGSAWVIGDNPREGSIRARSLQADLDPRITTEWDVIDFDPVTGELGAIRDPRVFGAACDFGDEGSNLDPSRPISTFADYSGTPKSTATPGHLLLFVGASAIFNSLRC